MIILRTELFYEIKVLNQCLIWHILRSYQFVVEVNFNPKWILKLWLNNPGFDFIKTSSRWWCNPRCWTITGTSFGRFFNTHSNKPVLALQQFSFPSFQMLIIKSLNFFCFSLRRFCNFLISTFSFAIYDFNDISFFVELAFMIWFTSVCEAKQINISMIIKNTPTWKFKTVLIGKSKLSF